MTLLDRILGRPERTTKAVYGGAAAVAWQNDVPLSVMGNSYQERAAKYLAAYKVGWFYKAGSKISRDLAGLECTLAYEDTEGDNAADIPSPASSVPFDALSPGEQFLRLMEKPNPYQTGRALRQKTQIRLDFAGAGFWFLDNGAGLPNAIYGISPTRMWPSKNNRGELIGWIMDYNAQGGGVPFTTDEILPFFNETPDDDSWCGMGVVEAVFANVPLSGLMNRHTADVLSTGGRLAGMAWPKDRTLDETEFAEAQRAWRNVASDPNAARRLLLFPEPMEYNAGAATPKEIGIPELATLNRDDILTAFPISPYQLGVPMPGGLNSAETRKEDRRDYWEGTIHPRAELLEEVIQSGLMPRYEQAEGRPLDFDFEEPNLDDAPTLIEKVGAYRGLVAIGFDAKESVAAVGLDHIKWNGLPPGLNPDTPPAPAAVPATPDTAGLTSTVQDTTRRDRTNTTQVVVGKAKMTRDDVTGREFPGLHAAVRAFLREQRARISKRIAESLPPTKAERANATPGDWWDQAAEDAAFIDRLRGVYLTLGRDALQISAENLNRIIAGKTVDRVLTDILERAGLRITDINETTRRTIAQTLEEGIRRGYSVTQITDGVAAEGYGGVQGALLANGVSVWDDYRAEMIARTETTTAFNQAALGGYAALSVAKVQAIDGDQDEMCANRNGREFDVAEALDMTDHPNGTLDWVPIT